MPVPVVETFTFQGNDPGSPDSDITLSKPSGLAVGDLCLVFVCSDHDDGPAWEAKTGWTLEINIGTADSDTSSGIYWRIADGTEGATETFTSTETDDLVGWWIRISGVDTADPINNKSSQESTGSESNYDIIGHNTTLDDCLALWFMTFDGADGAPWVVTGTGWTDFEYGESPGGDNTDVSGGWGQKDMASAGATGTVNVEPDATDGMTGGQISINAIPPTIALMNAAGIVGVAQNLTVVTGAVTIPMNTAALNAIAQNFTLVPGAVTVSMNAGVLNITAQNLTVFNALVVALATAGLTVTAQPLTVVPGAATISMQVADINLTGETIQVVPGAVTIQANAAVLNALAQQLQVVPGDVTIAMQDAQITGTAETLQIVEGAVIVTMQTAQIVSAGEQLQVIPGEVTITMQDAQMTITAQSLSIVSFTKILIRGINKESGEPIVIEGEFRER